MFGYWMILSLVAIAAAEEDSFEAIDTHAHLLLHGLMRYDHWVKDNRNFLKRNFSIDYLETRSRSTPAKKYVLVGATRDGDEELDNLYKWSKDHESIVGIVPRLALNDSLETILDRNQPNDIIVGIRDTYHPVAAMRTDQTMWPALAMLEGRGKTLDVYATSGDLKGLASTAKKYPNLKIIIDHMARPFNNPELATEWNEGITEIAQYPNVFIKISGFLNVHDSNVIKNSTIQVDRSLSHFKEFVPKVEHVINSFGVDRCMFGSDWPNGLTAFNNYKQIYDFAAKLFQNLSLSKKDQKKIFYQNAVKIYNLDITSGTTSAAGSIIMVTSVVVVSWCMR